MFWNFLCNILFCFATVIPAMPAECFKFVDMYGWLAFVRPEFGGHLFTKVLFSLTSQYGVAIVLNFHFRYVAICHSQRIKTVHPAWGYFYCIGFHLVSALFILYTCILFSSGKSPSKTTRIQKKLLEKMGCFVTVPTSQQEFNDSWHIWNVCCFCNTRCNTDRPVIPAPQTSGKNCRSAHCGYAKKGFVESMAVPILMAGVPALVGAFCVYYTHLKGVNEVFLVCILVLLNHGTPYGIVTFCVFSEYRKVVKRMLLRIVHA
ncbi:hypothetical protein L596_020792 [Steinernema carpocapsae]|uniref:Uncharacterized protein n=1 Tax=Steinernema carpocapsae TaxID=34508 RepID=A0A4U5MUK0_STECR|nr:hypothetical protein L596_020792 [Steinernema carpocapsae]